MKKKIVIYVLLMNLVFCIAYAHGEPGVLFSGIQWLSNKKEVKDGLIAKGFLDENIYNETQTETVFIMSEDGENYRPDTILEYKDVCATYSLNNCVKGRIAGFPLKNLKVSFAYNGEYQLIAAQIELINADYFILKEKIEKVYGSGNLYQNEEEGIESVVWKGEDNSAVMLYTQSDGLDYTLIYGRLDADEILANCLASDPDDLSGL